MVPEPKCVTFYFHLREDLMYGLWDLEEVCGESTDTVINAALEAYLATKKLEGAHTPIRRLGLRGSCRGPLIRQGLFTVGAVSAMSDEELLQIRNFGKASLRALRAACAQAVEA